MAVRKGTTVPFLKSTSLMRPRLSFMTSHTVYVLFKPTDWNDKVDNNQRGTMIKSTPLTLRKSWSTLKFPLMRAAPSSNSSLHSSSVVDELVGK